MREVENRCQNGDASAQLAMDAFILQTAKSIAMFGANLSGKVDRIILTGGIAHSSYITEKVTEAVGYLAPVVVLAGEREMEALALGALRVLRGQEEMRIYGEE